MKKEAEKREIARYTLSLLMGIVTVLTLFCPLNAEMSGVEFLSFQKEVTVSGNTFIGGLISLLCVTMLLVGILTIFVSWSRMLKARKKAKLPSFLAFLCVVCTILYMYASNAIVWINAPTDLDYVSYIPLLINVLLFSIYMLCWAYGRKTEKKRGSVYQITYKNL